MVVYVCGLIEKIANIIKQAMTVSRNGGKMSNSGILAILAIILAT